MSLDSTTGFALDVNGLSRIRRAESAEQGAGLRPVAQQFEALFLNMMLKSMREAIPKGDLVQSPALDTLGSMRDQQFAQALAGKGIGLADLLVEQLSARRGEAAATRDDQAALGASGVPWRIPPELASTRQGTQTQAASQANDAGIQDRLDRLLGEVAPHVQAFLDRLAGPALRVAERSGIPARLILAQAALETGWGRSVADNGNGESSHNLFGIKATGGWQGDSTLATTHEFEGGAMVKREERFRSYASIEQSLEDYARLLTESPRYSGIKGASSEEGARQLQAGGYATDPDYADKLISILRQLPASLEHGWASDSATGRSTPLDALGDLARNPTALF